MVKSSLDSGVPPHRTQRYFPAVELEPVGALSPATTLRLVEEIIRLLKFERTLSTASLCNLLVVLGVDVPPPPSAPSAVALAERAINFWAVVSCVVQVRVVNGRLEGDSGSAERIKAAEGWTLMGATTGGGALEDQLEWQLTDKGQELLDILADECGQKPAFVEYERPPLGAALVAYPPFRTIERICSTPAERRVLLSMPADQLRPLSPEERNVEIAAVKAKFLSCTVRGCPMNDKTLDKDAKVLKVGLHDGTSFSPYAWGDESKALCPAHLELALIDRSCGVPEADFLQETRMTDTQRAAAVSLTDKYAMVYRCVFGCARPLGAFVGRALGGLDSPSGDTDLSAAGFGMHTLWQCEECVAALDPTHLVIVEKMALEVKDKTYYTRRDITRFSFPAFFHARSWPCDECGSPRGSRDVVEIVLQVGSVCTDCFLEAANSQADSLGIVKADRVEQDKALSLSLSLDEIRDFTETIADSSNLSTLAQCAIGMRVGTAVPHPQLLCDLMDDGKLMRSILNKKGFELVKESIPRLVRLAEMVRVRAS